MPTILRPLLVAILLLAFFGCLSEPPDSEETECEPDGVHGVCIWYCQGYKMPNADSTKCYGVVTEEQECADMADEHCLTEGGTVTELVLDTDCVDCSDQSCWPSWFLGWE